MSDAGRCGDGCHEVERAGLCRDPRSHADKSTGQEGQGSAAAGDARTAGNAGRGSWSHLREYNPPAAMGSLSTYLFDLDGTLIDTTELIMSSFRHTMQTHLERVPPEAEWRAGFGTPLRPQLARYAEGNVELDALVVTYREYQWANHDRLVSTFPGVTEVLVELADRGAQLGVVTSKNRTGALHGLRHCGLDEFFEVLVSADDVAKHKPDPTPVVAALVRLGASSEDAVFIGDSPFDCMAGRAAGVSTAAALWGAFDRDILEPQAPDHWLECPEQVLHLAGGMPRA